MGGKKSFITNANKKATENFGNTKIEGIVKALSNCGFYCAIEPKLHNEKFSTRNKIRNPDIIIKFGGMEVILESDGKVHGTLEQPTQSTMQRNNDFEKTNYNYIVINHEHIKELKKILGIVANDDDLANFISAYRACEEYSKHISKKPVEE
jgi:hypothetical protein